LDDEIAVTNAKIHATPIARQPIVVVLALSHLPQKTGSRIKAVTAL
jgi:hypothetical protein